MKERLKRYGVAIFLLLFVTLLMMLGTYGVTKIGEKMFEDTGVDMKPRGENLAK